MPQHTKRSAVYRTLVNCDDPKGAVDVTIRQTKSDAQKAKTEGLQKCCSRSFDSSPSRKKLHKSSSFNFLDISQGSEKLSFNGENRSIANDLLRGALDLQESLVMLEEFHTHVSKPKKKMKKKLQKKISADESDNELGFQRSRSSVDSCSRDSFEELRRVIRNGLAKQNVFLDGEEDDVDSTSIDMDMPVQKKKLARTNVIAKLMGLEDLPPTKPSINRLKEIPKMKNFRSDLNREFVDHHVPPIVIMKPLKRSSSDLFWPTIIGEENFRGRRHVFGQMKIEKEFPAADEISIKGFEQEEVIVTETESEEFKEVIVSSNDKKDVMQEEKDDAFYRNNWSCDIEQKIQDHVSRKLKNRQTLKTVRMDEPYIAGYSVPKKATKTAFCSVDDDQVDEQPSWKIKGAGASTVVCEKLDAATRRIDQLLAKQPSETLEFQTDENARKRRSSNGRASLKALLWSSPSFVDNAEHLFNLNTSHLINLQTYEINELSPKLTLDCSEEILERQCVLRDLGMKKYFRNSISLDELVDEVCDGVEDLRSYGSNCDVVVERDMRSCGVESGVWDFGWRGWFSIGDLVGDMDNLILSHLIGELFC